MDLATPTPPTMAEEERLCRSFVNMNRASPGPSDALLSRLQMQQLAELQARTWQEGNALGVAVPAVHDVARNRRRAYLGQPA